jgi:hypothetical protein
MHEEIVRKIAQIEGIYVRGVNPLVYCGDHLVEGFAKQVFRVLIAEHAEFRHARTHHRHTSPQFSLSSHFAS